MKPGAGAKQSSGSFFDDDECDVDMNKARKIDKAWRLPRVLLLAAALLVAGVTGANGADGSALAQKLAALRTKVEELAADVEAQKEDMRGQLRSYAAQKAELELELQREEMRLAQLRQAKARRVDKVDDDKERAEIIRPVVAESAQVINAEVREGLPFKTDERAKEIAKITKRLDEGLIKAEDAVARLWDRVEDEFRLSKENGVYRQVITLDGAQCLADVARVGMVMLFFETKDAKVGYARREGGSWRYVTVHDEDAKKNIARLFESFKKQIRAGLFVLPDALPEGGTR